MPHDAGAVGGGVADIALGLALVGQLSGFEALGGRQTVDDPQVRLLLGMMREARGPVRGEDERIADPQRIGQRRRLLAQHPLPLRPGPIVGTGAVEPQPRRGASAVALPVRRRAGERRRQRGHPRMVPGQTRGASEPEPLDVSVEAHSLDDLVADLELTGVRGHEDMGRVLPAEHRHRRRTQPGQPAQGTGGHLGDHQLGLTRAEGHERHLRPVRREPRGADRHMVRGQSPGTASRGRDQPDIVVCGEGDEISMDVGIAQISHVRHITSNHAAAQEPGTDAQATCTRQ